MKVVVEDLDLLKKKLSVEVDREAVVSKEEEVCQTLRTNVLLPGFRKGKIPLSVLRKKFSKEIKGEVVNALIPEVCEKAFDDKKLRPVHTPKIDDLDYKGGESLVFSATCEVYPSVEPQGYKDIDINEVEKDTVSDEKIDEVLKDLAEQYSEQVLKDDGVVEDGDFVSTSLEMSIDGEKITDFINNPEDHLIVAGAGKFAPEVEQELAGRKKGDTFEVDVMVPEACYNKKHAGKSVSFKVVVNEIKYKKTPQLDDEFAKSLGDEFKTIKDVKKKIAKSLTDSLESRNKNKFKMHIKDSLLRNADFDVPPILLNKELERLVFQKRMEYYREGNEWGMIGFDVEKAKSELTEQATSNVRYYILVNTIAEDENIVPSDSEIEIAIREYGARVGKQATNGMPNLSEDEINKVQFEVMESKLVTFITDGTNKVDIV